MDEAESLIDYDINQALSKFNECFEYAGDCVKKTIFIGSEKQKNLAWNARKVEKFLDSDCGGFVSLIVTKTGLVIHKKEENTKNFSAPVAQWLARRTVGRKVWGSNPIRVMWDFSALAGSYPELGVLWAQWVGWNHTAELHPLNGCVFEGVALIT